MQIDQQHWPVVSALFDQALDLPVGQRQRWLDELRQDQRVHRETLLHLLEAHSRVETLDFLGTLPKHGTAAEPQLVADGQRTVGPYRLLRELGRGGMGSVWLAERSDGLLKWAIALKLPHPGLATRAFAERLARERDILASLTHPNIARLYDAGISAEGQPYIALAYVAGQTLIAHAQARQLGVRARIELFMQICDAVQYAHAHLIIHRDIKPANVLVGDDGQVQLLDFGIAKLLVDGQAEATELTLNAGLALTPDYASPEHLAGIGISTASDVYSLGVLLYELLSGVRPYRLARQPAAAMAQSLHDTPVPRPSSMSGDAGHARALRGDLDTIVLKAMKPEIAQRYATVQALQADLQRHLDRQPVLAQPDRPWYRARKFIGRNRWLVAGSGAVALSMLGAAAVSFWQARVAREQAELARLEGTKARAVQKFLLDIFSANSEDGDDPVRARQTTARELLDIGARRVQKALKDAPASQVEVYATLAEMYYDLGLAEDGARMEELGIEVRRRLYGRDSMEVARALVPFAATLAGTQRRELILPTLDEARRILDLHHDDASALRADLLVRYAQRYQNLSVARMRDYAEQALQLLRTHPQVDGNLIAALHLAARAHGLLGDHAKAEALYREAIARPSEGDQTRSENEQYLADVLVQQQKFDEAESLYRASLARDRQRSGERHPSTLWAQSRLGLFLASTGRTVEGRRLLDDALQAALDTVGASDTLLTPGMRVYSARGWLAQGRPERAAPLLEQAIETNARHYAGSAVLAGNLRDQALAWLGLGRAADALAQLRRALAMHQAAIGDGARPGRFNEYHMALARALLAQDDADGALAELAKVIDTSAAAGLPMPADEVQAALLRAEIDAIQGHAAEALRGAQWALSAVRASPLHERFAGLEAQALKAVTRLQAAHAVVAH